MIIPFPIVFFVSTLVVDLIFLNQGDPVWALAAVWLLGRAWSPRPWPRWRA
jgi:uncharacterized membrane protein